MNADDVMALAKKAMHHHLKRHHEKLTRVADKALTLMSAWAETRGLRAGVKDICEDIDGRQAEVSTPHFVIGQPNSALAVIEVGLKLGGDGPSVVFIVWPPVSESGKWRTAMQGKPFAVTSDPEEAIIAALSTLFLLDVTEHGLPSQLAAMSGRLTGQLTLVFDVLDSQSMFDGTATAHVKLSSAGKTATGHIKRDGTGLYKLHVRGRADYMPMPSSPGAVQGVLGAALIALFQANLSAALAGTGGPPSPRGNHPAA